MTALLGIVERLSKWMNAVAGIALVFIMFLTVADVILRYFGHPIVGTYEIVGLGGAVVIGFGIPITSWHRGHIFVDFFIQRFSKSVQGIFNFATRIAGMVLFSVIGWNVFIMAFEYYKSGEVTLTRSLPFYPVAYGLGACCFIQVLVLLCDLVKIAGGKYE
ncbi:MAG: Tripartite ATP-independent periplasmic transporter [Syntrophorhabdus sp. PtaU1.Bin153]|nr:MAG: Tripartite ATP-independent periplasmic transporter [Syntrophorhabdus sp. PtaU1.Bin153]